MESPTLDAVKNLPDAEVLAGLRDLATRSQALTARLLIWLSEADARRLYAGAACPSMFAYGTTTLGMSEGAAYRHIGAARVARRFPALLDAVAEGQLHLAAIAVLTPHLTQDNHRRLIAAASGKTRRQVEQLVADLAPRVQLYELPVGEVVTLRAYTRSGYVRAVNTKVYGTFTFDGLERSDLAAANNLVDMVTFRELYGRMSDSQQAELAGIKAEAGVSVLSREDAEAALFGGGGSLEVEAREGPAIDDALAMLDDTASAAGPLLDERTYSRAEMQDGMALSGAVIVKDPRHLDEARQAVQAAADAAGLGLEVVDWQQASGIVGQLVLFLQVVLYLAILIIFLVTVVIINNTMVMVAMERTAEIGTMRAIGARRPFVVLLLLFETVLLGLVAGGAGAAASTGLITLLGQVGIPAPADIVVLLFAGPRLYPTFTATDFAVVLVISLASVFYPALMAAQVQPVVAMSGKE